MFRRVECLPTSHVAIWLGSNTKEGRAIVNRSSIRRAARLSKFGRPLTESERNERVLQEVRQQEEDLRYDDMGGLVLGERSSHAKVM